MANVGWVVDGQTDAHDKLYGQYSVNCLIPEMCRSHHIHL